MIAADLGEVAKSIRAVAENMSGLYCEVLYDDEGFGPLTAAGPGALTPRATVQQRNTLPRR